MTYLKSNRSIEFDCESCGYSKKSPPGYSVSKSYEYITKRKSNFGTSRGSESSSGFPTKKRRRRKKSNFSDTQSEKLEEDRKIIDNAEKVIQEIEKSDLPPVLKPIIRDPTQMPIYYNFLEKNPPPVGKKIDETINLTGLRKKLKEKGIENLYQFQEDVYKEILNGNNVLISAPTGLGKTEAFLLPIIYSIVVNSPNPLERKSPQALLIYPTKALAADQLEKIEFYSSSVGLSVAKFDGDTKHEQRGKIYRSPPDILITNADMIHYHLQGNISFQNMMNRIKFLVIDEIHLCVGSFGTNVSWIIRRLRRFSPNVQCIGASATISNAKQFAERIFSAPVKLISIGTARKSDLHMLISYPKERSNLSIMTKYAETFVENGKKTLVFGNGHLSAESLNIMLNNRGVKSEVHRAGLGMKHRSSVENKFKAGDIDVIVSTPTLELGIDIGNLDSVVSMLTGLTSFVQRIGRAGRQGQESFATMVLRGDDPISAYYARNPNEYLSELDPAYVEPNNQFVAKYQFLSMVMDKPLEKSEWTNYSEHINKAKKNSFIRKEGNTYKINNPRKVKNFLKNYSIRGIGKSVSIWNYKQKIGERSLPMALSELHPGAIYLHAGNSYRVRDFNSKLKTAKVSKIRTKRERTQALRGINPAIKNIQKESEVSGLQTAYCELELTETVEGYIKQDIFTNKIIGKYLLEDPISYKFSTMGFLISLPHPIDFISNLSQKEKKQVLGGTFHAIEHVLIESGNSFSGGGANQIGGISLGDTGLVFVYDGTEGGSGLSKLLYDSLEKGIRRTKSILENCACGRQDGCPRCTYSYQCGNNNQPLNRIGAIEALERFGKDSTDLFYDFEGLETFVIEPDFFQKY